MSTTIKIDIESLRAVAKDLRNIAMIAGVRCEELMSRGGSLETVSTSALSGVAPCVEELKDQATSLDARVDTAILINSGDGKNVPQTGVITYRIDGNDSKEPKEVKHQLGLAMASLGSDISLHDLGQGGGERIKLFRSQLANWSNDSSVMGTLFDTLNPEGSLRIMSILGKRASSAFDSSEEEREESRSALNFMNIGLGKATQGWSEGKAEQFGQDMISASMRTTGGFRDSGLHEAMAFVAHKNSTVSSAFISGALNRLREIEAESGGPIQMATAPVFLRELVGENDYEWASDVGNSLLRDLSFHPESAMKFFSEDEDRADYWVKHRPYNDAYCSIASALDAASTDVVTRVRFPRETAKIAALAINEIGGENGVGSITESFWGVNVECMNTARPLSHILATYIDAMNYSIACGENREGSRIITDDAKDIDNKPLPVMPVFNVKRLEGVLNVIGRDDQGFLSLRVSQNHYQYRSMKTPASYSNMDLPAGELDKKVGTAFKDSAQKNAKTEAFIVRSIGAGQIDEAEARDAYAKAWIELAGMPAASIKSAVDGMIPEGGSRDKFSRGSGLLVDYFKMRAEETWASRTDGAVDRAKAMASSAERQYAKSLLFAADEKGLAGYQRGGPALGGHNAAAVELPDGTYRLMRRAEYEQLVEDARPAVRNDGESDPDFQRRKRDSEAAKRRLESVDRDLEDIAESNSGYADMMTHVEVEQAYGSGFQPFFK
ncbi:hypothetical protein [Actinomyces bowdenii]|uniref:Uncharacterized protein n=1 Tax=Actinomyces bowdenii TaxID=131109 RepID=A0A853EJ91_9ACTO|nr:hypothetical protein [Actinomyces bowdenii]MBF0696662.1 hypothetical protein [Actinomyces bowdenii]NYS68835.1 hypothetical protein [Actinomyces bowdenii]